MAENKGAQKNKSVSVTSTFAGADGKITPRQSSGSVVPAGKAGPSAVQGDRPANSGGGVTGLTGK